MLVSIVSGESDIGIRQHQPSGIIELSIRGEWRPVCDSFWSNVDARVACKQLGLPYTGTYLVNVYYTQCKPCVVNTQRKFLWTCI